MIMNGRNKKVTAGILVIAIGLLLFGTIGGTRAVLTDSESFEVETTFQKNLDAVLLENGSTVSDGGQLLTSFGKNNPLAVGKKYDEALAVKNSGNMDAYVRLTINKYWTDANGKRIDLSPELIKLTLAGNGWLMDKTRTTKDLGGKSSEQIVLYYSKPLKAGASTPAAISAMQIDSEVSLLAVQTEEKNGKYTTITTTYTYDGLNVGLDASVDAVQTHNAADAILEAWGVEVTKASNGTLSLK